MMSRGTGAFHERLHDARPMRHAPAIERRERAAARVCDYRECMEARRGTVVAMSGRDATLQMEDGESRVVSVPEMLDVGVGTTAQIVDTGNDAPIIVWGGEPSIESVRAMYRFASSVRGGEEVLNIHIDDNDEVPPHLLMADFRRFFVDLVDEGDDGRVREFLVAIEALASSDERGRPKRR